MSAWFLNLLTLWLQQSKLAKGVATVTLASVVASLSAYGVFEARIHASEKAQAKLVSDTEARINSYMAGRRDVRDEQHAQVLKRLDNLETNDIYIKGAVDAANQNTLRVLEIVKTKGR